MRCICTSCGDDTSSPLNHRCAAAQPGRSKRDRIARLRSRLHNDNLRDVIKGVLDLLEDEL